MSDESRIVAKHATRLGAGGKVKVVPTRESKSILLYSRYFIFLLPIDWTSYLNQDAAQSLRADNAGYCSLFDNDSLHEATGSVAPYNTAHSCPSFITRSGLSDVKEEKFLHLPKNPSQLLASAITDDASLHTLPREGYTSRSPYCR